MLLQNELYCTEEQNIFMVIQKSGKFFFLEINRLYMVDCNVMHVWGKFVNYVCNWYLCNY